MKQATQLSAIDSTAATVSRLSNACAYPCIAGKRCAMTIVVLLGSCFASSPATSFWYEEARYLMIGRSLRYASDLQREHLESLF
jgi:hypothetical protein